MRYMHRLQNTIFLVIDYMLDQVCHSRFTFIVSAKSSRETEQYEKIICEIIVEGIFEYL